MTAQLNVQATETDPSVDARHTCGQRAGRPYPEPAAKVAMAGDPRRASTRSEEVRERLAEFATRVPHRATRGASDNAVDRARFRAPVPASITAVTLGHDRVYIQVRGRLDRVGIARLRSALARARAVGSPRLVVDLTPVTWWDHSLARVLAWARLQLRGRNQTLVITGAPARLRAEIDTEEKRLGYPLWRGLCPGDPRYRPETANQP